MSYEQRTLIEVMDRPLPYWFKETKTTPAWMVTNVRRGKHPLGSALLTPIGPNTTCRNCVHRKKFKQGTTWFKCELFTQNTHGTATDNKGYWAACNKWERAYED